MAFQIKLYCFNKRENSTKIPEDSGKIFTGLLKENSGIVAPSISFNIGELSPVNYNYAYIPQFSRYYFIEEWTFDTGFWIATMKEDVLASWKNDIGSASEYVIRSASSYNGEIVDTLYPATSNISIIKNEIVNNPFETSSGYYVLGIISKSANENMVGSITYYVMTSVLFNEFMHFMLGDLNYTGIDFETISNMTEELFKGYFNPTQYIVSCLWFPFEVPSSGTAFIEFGYWESAIFAGKLGATSYTVYSDISIPKHPQAADRGSYLNISPFSRYMLNFRPFGNYALDSNRLANVDMVTCSVRIDLLTGLGVLKVRDENGNDILYTQAQIGVPIQISQISINAVAGVTSTVGAVGSIMSGNVGSILGNIGNSVNSWSPQLNTSGSVGSRAEYDGTKQNIVGEFALVVEEDIEHRGKPLCEKRQLNSLSGFIMVEDADITINGTQNENRQIKNYLEGGFYYE